MSTSAATPRPAGSRREDPDARRHGDEVPSITSAPESLEDDQARRMRRYLFQMGFRVVCFWGAYLASGWLRWTLVAIAVVIPYIAVILVNAGRDRVQYETSAVVPEGPKELPPLPDGARVVVVDPEPGPDPDPDPHAEEHR
ncbi:DUF3099 domain-containing protein [Xylanimonas protaetiae]|uniref:DUF3099 domain-containing protein n=1 Tax=Xylanimonas protaetiae TaxID=2509457 RepID=A0A4P6F5X4_9MICO|nr:DUF3099 domain-containing protein [Xylanimonas protaetiae]QAY70795.1 DUF3099 domain-containing protein [Xylanimonas protaetiae]